MNTMPVATCLRPPDENGANLADFLLSRRLHIVYAVSDVFNRVAHGVTNVSDLVSSGRFALAAKTDGE